MSFAEQLSTFFGDFGVPAQAGGFSALVIFDAPEDQEFSGRVLSKNYTATYVAGSFGQLGFGSQMVIAGVAYKVLEVRDIQDGMVQRARLEQTGAAVAWTWGSAVMTFDNQAFTMDGG